MSDVPPGYTDVPPEPSGPQRSGGAFGSDVPPPGPDVTAAARVRRPAIFLLVVNGVNLLVGAYLLLNAFAIKSDTAAAEAMVNQQWSTLTPEQLDQVHQIVGSPHQFVVAAGNIFLWGGGLSAIVGVLGVLGGMRMLRLRSYGLALTSSILTVIPLATPCCLIGQIAGIWALIVLLNRTVRSGFH
ncbi:MAG TPA: hypothetical protein VMS17_03755 [Gemmataceae bacterium]|nr:hypothetical protein [Gemmataceae bacterium]